jgi:hypothetical protein
MVWQRRNAITRLRYVLRGNAGQSFSEFGVSVCLTNRSEIEPHAQLDQALIARAGCGFRRLYQNVTESGSASALAAGSRFQGLGRKARNIRGCG